jgi:hypothetical protein
MSKNYAAIHRRVLSAHAFEPQFIPQNKHFASFIAIFDFAQNFSFVKAATHCFTFLAIPVGLLATGKALFIYALWYLCGPCVKRSP